MDISALRERRGDGSMTVSELNALIKNMFDNNRVFSSVTIKGEISNFTNHRSGHLYFSLKDRDSQIKAVMFRSSAFGLKFMPENGMKVIAHGAVSVFTRDGGYQLYVSSMQPDGIGALFLAYEQLKARLASEGLFDEDAKKPIPRFPSAIGVITSPTGAAVRDIINVLSRRYPLATIYVYPTLVQGDGAEDSLCRALEYFDKSRLVDTLIIGRGGGSIEDLWAFNSERLARMIYACRIPVISAVGHETDFTICDFVADLRAPTPSAAAELAAPDVRELMERVDILRDRMDRALVNRVDNGSARLERVVSSSVLSDPNAFFAEKGKPVSDLYTAACSAVKTILENAASSSSAIIAKLEALSPLSTLARGYSVVEFDSRVVTDVRKIKPGDNVSVILHSGAFDAVVSEIKERKNEE